MKQNSNQSINQSINIPFLLIFSFLLLLSTVILPQYNPTNSEMELAVQIQSMGDHGSITAELTNVTTAYGTGPNVCDITLESNYTSTEIYNDVYFGSYKGFFIQDFGEYDNPYMKKSLNRLKFKNSSGGYLNYYTGESLVELEFFYDTRDFNYYGNTLCVGTENRFNHDVTVRLVRDGTVWELWFFNGPNTLPEVPSTAGGWVHVSQSTKKCWVEKGRTQCFLDWANVAPTTPQKFEISSSTGQHPTLTWQKNREPDLAGYKLYQSYDGGTYSLLTTLGVNATSFTDNGVIITNNKFDPSVCYKITAYDTDSKESDPAIPRCTVSAAVSKQSISNNESASEEYLLFNAYPNPFNPMTKISYSLKEAGSTKIILYDLSGRIVDIMVDEYKNDGRHSFVYDASFLSSGTYFYKISVNDFFDIKKMQVLK